jgi:hypothetical protein
MAYNYETAERTLQNVMGDLAILAGDVVGPSDVSWQDVAGTAAVNLSVLASLIEDAREEGSFISFPSVSEAVSALGL